MQEEKTVIRGGTLVFSHGVEEADIWIEDRKIRRIAKDTLVKRSSSPAAAEYDASGMYVLPGFVFVPNTPFYLGEQRDAYLQSIRELVRTGCTTLVDIFTPKTWMDKSQVLYRLTRHYNSLIDYLWHVRLECGRFTPKEVLHWCRQGYSALHITVVEKHEIYSRDWETISSILSSYRSILHLHLPETARLIKEEREEIRRCWLETTRYWKVRTVVPGLFHSADQQVTDPFYHLFWLLEGQTEQGMRLLHRRWYESCPIASSIHDLRVAYRRKWCLEEELLCLIVRVAAKNAAKAVGLYPQKGSLSPGADADIIFLEKENWLTKIAPSTILKFSELFLPSSVMSNGKWIYRDLSFSPMVGMGRCLRGAHPYSFVI